VSGRAGGVLAALLLPLLAAAQKLGIPVEREEISGAIAGRACRDLNEDGRCAGDEPGYPNLRLVLESGQQVITDATGRYHLARVGARIPESGPLRLRPGRHRLRVDARPLSPGTRVVPEAVTVELPMASLAVQDFAIQEPDAQVPPLKSAHADQPPTGRLGAGGGVRFEVSGQAAPGDRVEVEGASTQVNAAGRFRAAVQLERGGNEIAIRVESPHGAVRLYSQRIDVIEQGNSVLVVPREIRPSATLRLPASNEQPAAAGPSRLRVEAPPGTVIAHPAGQVTVGAAGIADVPLTLVPGSNAVPLLIDVPGQTHREERLEIAARARPFIAGLADLEAAIGVGPSAGSARVFGRGAAHVEMPLWRWLVEGNLDLRDDDVAQIDAYGPAVLARPRNVVDLERAIDPDRLPEAFGDHSTSLDPNSPEGRLRIDARHPDLGRVGYGTYRAQFAGAETGRYHRELFGAFASLHTDPKADVGVQVEAFASPGNADLATGLHTTPAHAEFLATGGSLFHLPHTAISRGSERVRVVVRDGLTGVPLAERHLVRGVDYELDAASGRLLLASPLSFVGGAGLLLSDPPTASPEPMLVVDYERLNLGGDARGAVGAEAGARFGPIQIGAGAAQDAQGTDRYWLLRGSAGAKLGSLSLSAEGAQSTGSAHGAGDVSLSDDGGFGFLSPQWDGDPGRRGWAFAARLRGPTARGGRIDASYRRRTPGYSDSERDASGALTQLSALVEQSVGPLVVGALGDARTAVDPREPFGRREIAARILSGYVGYRTAIWEVRLEGRDVDLEEDLRQVEGASVHGGRSSVGLSARYRVDQRLQLRAGQRFVVATRGEGAGAWDDTFTSVGAEVELDPRARVGVQGGWGPKLGPLAWLSAEVGRGSEIFYGSYSVDVDGPDFGERRAVTGARTRAADGTVVFVEDVSAHDATAVRMARAVGVSVGSPTGIELAARYERGVRHLLDDAPLLRRDAGGLALSWVRQRFRLHARAEARFDRGQSLLRPASDVERLQRLASAAGSWDVAPGLQLSGRMNWSDTLAGGVAEATLLEANAGLAWRIDPAVVVLYYGMERELAPPRRGFGVRTLRRVSLMPSMRFGDRVAIAAGAHLGWSTVDGNGAFVLSGSLRPSVRVIGGLELAAEVARRSAAPEGGELDALRGEVGYRFGPDLMLAAGYTALGFTGLGLSAEDAKQDRLYLRGEATW
jgi:hypothetical protein